MSRERKVFVDSGIKGWASARAELERIDHDARRDLLVQLAQSAGVHGSAGMKFLVQLMRYAIDGADYPAAPKTLKPHDIEFVERKASEAVQPYIDANDHRLYKVIRSVGGVTEDAA